MVSSQSDVRLSMEGAVFRIPDDGYEIRLVGSSLLEGMA